MKKNISINLFGTLYNIDEDAYNLLENYLQSMARYFSRQEGGEEIADDIEHRVAELLWQRKEGGMEAVSIEVVKEIIATIGNAEEIGEGEEQPSEPSAEEPATEGEKGEKTFQENLSQFAKDTGRFARETYDKGCKHMNTHHFYRRMDDKVLGGVCAGMVNYFEAGDSLLWRLSTVVVTVMLSFIGVGFAIPVIYLLLWLLAPVATTPEDRLRMQGKDVTPRNLIQQVMDESQRPIAAQDHRASTHGYLKVLLILVGVMLLIPLFSSLIVAVIALCAAIGLLTGMLGGLTVIPEFASFVEATQPYFVIALVCGILVIALPIYGIIRLIRSSSKRLSTSAFISLIVLWFFANGLGIANTVFTCIKGEEWDHTSSIERRLKHNSAQLEAIGWKLERQQNLGPRFVQSRSGFCDMPKFAISLDVAKYDSVSYSARFVKHITMEEGSHQLLALTEGGQEGLTCTLRYTDKGEEKAITILTSTQGQKLQDVPFEAIKDNPLLHKADSLGWEDFAHDEENWYLHQAMIPHSDACEGTLTIEALHCTIPAKIRDVRVVKLGDN